MAFWNRSQPVEQRTPLVERRDPTAATQIISYGRPGVPQLPTWDAEQAIQQGYLANSTVWACAQAIAKAVAGCPLRAGMEPRDAQSVRPQSKLATLLGPPPGTPNPMMTGRRLLFWTALCRVLAGRYAWELEPSNPGAGDVLRIWPLAVTRLKPKPAGGGLSYFNGFEFQYANGKRVQLRNDQVFYAWDMSPGDPSMPETPLQAARYDVSVAIMQDRYDVGFLRNNATPATMVTYAPFGEDADEDAFQRQFIAQHSGPDNAGKNLFMQGAFDPSKGLLPSLDIKQIGMSQKDAMRAEIHKEKVEAICVAMGVPMGVLDASGRTFDNARVETVNFYERTILPMLADLSDDINMGLAPRLGKEVCWFDTDHISALQPPSKFLNMTPVALVDGKIITAEELRAELGYSTELPAELQSYWDQERGDVSDAVTATVDKLALAAQILISSGFDPEAVLAAVGLPPIPMDETPQEAQQDALAVVPPAEPMSSVEGEQRDQEQAAEQRARAVRVVLAHVDALEQAWTSAMRALFARQERSVLARLHGKRGRQMIRADEPADPTVNPDVIFNQANWTAETAALAETLYTSVVAANGARLSADLGIDFDLQAPYVQDFILSRSNQLAGDVTDTTYSAIQDTLVEGVADGDTVDGLTARVKDVFSEADTVRAERIARTEVVGAMNGSSHAVGENAPQTTVAGQEWASVHDARTREAHAAADGQVRARGATFDVGGEQLKYPGDPSGSGDNTINCRCVLLLLTPEEYAQRVRAGDIIDLREAERMLRFLDAMRIPA